MRIQENLKQAIRKSYDLLQVEEKHFASDPFIVQELCGSRGGRPGLSVLTSLLASMDVKLY